MELVKREATIVKNVFDGELLVWFSLIDSWSEKVYWTKKKFHKDQTLSRAKAFWPQVCAGVWMLLTENKVTLYLVLQGC